MATQNLIAVIGGGIQGCCIALELARRGLRVELFERETAVLQGASRRCEGKLHLGYVFAADASLTTARLMVRGSAVFLPAMRRWLGPRADDLRVTAPFHYAVHRDSLLSPDELAERYAAIDRLLAQAIPADAHPPLGPMVRLASDDPTLAEYGEDVAAVFRSCEIAVHPDGTADALETAVISDPSITVRTSTPVSAVDRAGGRLQLADGWTEPYAHVVNCAWDGRLALDATAGVRPPAAWCFRMKYSLRVPGASGPPNTTVVLGPFADVVDLGGGDVYASWYPVRREWSDALAPPEWPLDPEPAQAREIALAVADGLHGVVPAVADRIRADPGAPRVRGGIIYALGETDVDDPASGLHERHRVGPSSYGTYHSVDTGKRTTAPLFALELAERIAPGRG